MEIIWSPKAKDNLLKTLEYWEVHNGSPLYSDKIIEEIKSLLQELSNNPYFMGRYIEKLNLLVCKTYFKRKIPNIFSAKRRQFNRNTTFQKF